eukprot:COSAG01_NODE_1275_length_10938_cov_100.784482_4_plen_326_part_00
MAQTQKLHLQLGTAGLSCACSQTTVHWTETTMVRQQLAKTGQTGNLLSMTRKIAREEGIRALYRGYSAAMVREFTYSSLRFGLYEPIKNLIGAGGRDAPFWKKIVAGLSTGALAASLMSPTDLVKIRMQKQTGPFHSIAHHVRDLMSQPPGGIRSLYLGVGTTVTRAAVLGATKVRCALVTLVGAAHPHRKILKNRAPALRSHSARCTDGHLRPVQNSAETRPALERGGGRGVQDPVRGVHRHGPRRHLHHLAGHQRPDAHHDQPAGDVPQHPALLVRHREQARPPGPVPWLRGAVGSLWTLRDRSVPGVGEAAAHVRDGSPVEF